MATLKNPRHERFAQLLVKGKTADAAYIEAGFKANRGNAVRLKTNENVVKRIAELTAPAVKVAGLTAERTLQEVARLAYADPRKMFRPDGSLIPIHEMDDDVAATVASIEHDNFEDDDGNRSGRTTKLKTWDKGAALDKAMRHLGLYERDNAQRAENLAIQVVTVGPK